jgi:hypothetical protein
MELKAIQSPDGRVAFATMVSQSALSEDQPEKNVADEDKAEDRFVLRVQAEVERRFKNVGNDYPFRIDDKGRVLIFSDNITQVGAVYLFCLFVSHAFDKSIVPKKLAPKVTNKIRDLFQAASTVAAGGWVTGPAASFGFPRPDGEKFLKALHRIYALFGDGKPVKKPRPAAARKIKDNGIDIIAWRRSIDRLGSTLYLIAQVASGADWVEKSVKSDREHFHKYWFEHQPGSQSHDAMFTPFGLEPEDPEDGTPYDHVLNDHMQSVAYRYGDLFYRDRLARYFADGLTLVTNGEKHIERVKDIQNIEKWVGEYTKRLKDAAAA